MALKFSLIKPFEVLFQGVTTTATPGVAPRAVDPLPTSYIISASGPETVYTLPATPTSIMVNNVNLNHDTWTEVASPALTDSKWSGTVAAWVHWSGTKLRTVLHLSGTTTQAYTITQAQSKYLCDAGIEITTIKWLDSTGVEQDVKKVIYNNITIFNLEENIDPTTRVIASEYILDTNSKLLNTTAVTTEYREYVDYGGGYEDMFEGKRGTDTFMAYDYLTPPWGDKAVPVIYKTDFENPDVIDEGYPPDYDDTYYYVGQDSIDGITYDKWRKIDTDFTYPTTNGEKYLYTNIITTEPSELIAPVVSGAWASSTSKDAEVVVTNNNNVDVNLVGASSLVDSTGNIKYKFQDWNTTLAANSSKLLTFSCRSSLADEASDSVDTSLTFSADGFKSSAGGTSVAYSESFCYSAPIINAVTAEIKEDDTLSITLSVDLRGGNNATDYYPDTINFALFVDGQLNAKDYYTISNTDMQDGISRIILVSGASIGTVGRVEVYYSGEDLDNSNTVFYDFDIA